MSETTASMAAGRGDGQVTLLSEEERIMLAERAVEAKKGAYCHYSSFRVGAAILLSPPSNPSSRQILTGANVENASYPVGTCAERCALAYAISTFQRPALPTLHAMAVSTDIWPPASPCGSCRQFIREFAPDSLPIYMYGKSQNQGPQGRTGGGGEGAETERYELRTLGELLPMSFGPRDLPSKGAPGTL